MGLAGTTTAGIAGVLITQRRSDRREEKNWQRERERERERWTREDAERTFEQRRDAYADFYESLREMTKAVYDHGMGRAELPSEWNFPTFRKLQHLALYTSSSVWEGAEQAYNTLLALGIHHDLRS